MQTQSDIVTIILAALNVTQLVLLAWIAKDVRGVKTQNGVSSKKPNTTPNYHVDWQNDDDSSVGE